MFHVKHTGWVRIKATSPILLLLALFLTLPTLSLAQPTTTTVASTIYASDGSLAQGTVYIKLNVSCTAPGGYLISALITDPVPVVDGAFSIALVPNATCVPANTSYRVDYDLLTAAGTPSPRLPETWIVPSSGTPVTIQTVRITTTPLPNTMIGIAQITPCPTSGHTLVSNGTAFVCGLGSGGLTDPTTTLGDILYRGASSVTRLAGNITTTRQFLRQVGTGSASAAPAWDTMQLGDLPNTLTSANYRLDFTGQTSVVLNHARNTNNTTTQCFLASTGQPVWPQAIVNTDLNNVTVTFSTSTTGYCVVNAFGALIGASQLDFTSQTSVVIPHTYSSLAVNVQCWTGTTTIWPASITRAATQVTVGFSVATTGSCTVR